MYRDWRWRRRFCILEACVMVSAETRLRPSRDLSVPCHPQHRPQSCAELGVLAECRHLTCGSVAQRRRYRGLRVLAWFPVSDIVDTHCTAFDIEESVP